MSRFVPKCYIHNVVRSATNLVASSIHNLLYFSQIKPFSSSLVSIEKIADRSAFTVSYLINSCGFTPEKALSASKYVKLGVANKPDSVISFFKNQGFTQTQISKLIKSYPVLLVYNPEKTILPKLKFLKSKGFSDSEVTVIVSRSPTILVRSLEKHLIPSFDFLRNFFQSEDKTMAAFKRYAGVMMFGHQKLLEANIEMFKQAGVPMRNIGYLVTYQPRLLLSSLDRLTQIVEDVKKLGFDPSRFSFLAAVHTFQSMSKSTRDKKVEVYKKWGWSKSDVVDAFRRFPWCMALSADNINSVMEFWVNKMGWQSSLLVARPALIALSLEKRIIPRCEVYQALVSKA